MINTKDRFKRRMHRVRSTISKRIRPGRMRLSVFRSSKNIYAQIIDDHKGHTIAMASTLESEIKKCLQDKKNTESPAQIIGKKIAERGIKAGAKQIVFDRGAYLYHGNIKLLAESARQNGLEF